MRGQEEPRPCYPPLAFWVPFLGFLRSHWIEQFLTMLLLWSPVCAVGGGQRQAVASGPAQLGALTLALSLPGHQDLRAGLGEVSATCLAGVGRAKGRGGQARPQR